jgi:hypothetical protein
LSRYFCGTIPELIARIPVLVVSEIKMVSSFVSSPASYFSQTEKALSFYIDA